MNNLIKSHVLVMIFIICIAGFISFWAIQKSSCFEINVDKQIKVKAGYCNTKDL